MNLITSINDPVLLFLVELLIKGSLILALTFFLGWIFRRASAASRYIVWLGGLGSLLLLPLAAGLLPSISIQAFSPDSASVAPAFNGSSALASGAERASPLRAAEPTVVPDFPATVGEAQQGVLSLIPKAGLLIWLAGGLLATLPFAGAFFRLRRQCREGAKLDSPEWQALFDDCSARLGVKRSIRLIEGSSGVMPMTWGVFRPVILFPQEVRSWADSRRRAVLLHELAHIKRNDCLSQVIARLACTVHWFNPLAWMAYRQVLRTREQACDDLVLLNDEVKPSDYADQLLSIATESRTGSFLGAGMIPMARKSALEGRVLAVLGESRRCRSASRKLIFAAGVSSLCLALMAGTLSFAAEASEEAEGVVAEEDALPISPREHPDPDATATGEGDYGEAGGMDSYGDGFSYTVQPGDTLSEIDRRFNSNLKDILTANRIDAQRLQVGQTLFIPLRDSQALPNEVEPRREQEKQMISFTILGEVNRPGVYEMSKGSSVLQALGYAGGWTSKAKLRDVQVLRKPDDDGMIPALTVNVDSMIHGRRGGRLFAVEDGDVIVIKEVLF